MRESRNPQLRQESDRIARLTEEFLARGGKITQITTAPISGENAMSAGVGPRRPILASESVK